MSGHSAWDKLSPGQKIVASTVDIMNHPEFALLSGVVMMGRVEVVETLLDKVFEAVGDLPQPLPLTFTAATNGLDCIYGLKFMGLQDRTQHRWIILHENFHKALHHCVDYREIVEKYPQLSNAAQDFCINGMIYEMDPQQTFAKPPTGLDGKPLEVCFDKKYLGKDWITILRDLLKQMPKDRRKQQQRQGQGQPQAGQGEQRGGEDRRKGEGQGSFDIHIQNPNAKQQTPAQQAQSAKIKQQIQDALHQGKMTVQRMAGKGKGSSTLDQLTQQRSTDWKSPLREFIEQLVSGHDNSRFCPPNKRFLPLGVLMPSHFSETTGEIGIFCDTSGSMYGLYPTVFGEIARICEQVRPSMVRLLWWDGEVQGEQIFKEGDYDKISSVIQPSGGGGTTPSCVSRYVAEKGYKFKAGIWLTDGYLDGSDCTMPFPVLWGVVDNTGFCPPQGRKIDISSSV